MTLKDQVCSLDFAKQLKDLGVKQESLFKWFFSPEGWVIVPQNASTGKLICPSAFNVAELGEMLPDGFFTTKGVFGCKSCFVSHNEIPYKTDVIYMTEANLRAMNLIYFLEKKLSANNLNESSEGNE